MLKTWKDFLKEEEGMGTVEVILIIVVLISLVVIFKEQLTSLVESIFDKITKQAKIFTIWVVATLKIIKQVETCFLFLVIKLEIIVRALL